MSVYLVILALLTAMFNSVFTCEWESLFCSKSRSLSQLTESYFVWLFPLSSGEVSASRWNLWKLHPRKADFHLPRLSPTWPFISFQKGVVSLIRVDIKVSASPLTSVLARLPPSFLIKYSSSWVCRDVSGATDWGTVQVKHLIFKLDILLLILLTVHSRDAPVTLLGLSGLPLGNQPNLSGSLWQTYGWAM